MFRGEGRHCEHGLAAAVAAAGVVALKLLLVQLAMLGKDRGGFQDPPAPGTGVNVVCQRSEAFYGGASTTESMEVMN